MANSNVCRYLCEEDAVLRLVALNRRDEPGLVRLGGGGGCGPLPARAAGLLRGRPGLRGRLPRYRAVPLRDPPELQEQVAPQPLLVVGHLALQGK